MSSFTCLAFLLLAIAAATAAAKEYQVGNSVGWRVPAPNETELYTIWASRRRFYIGDTLLFRYSASSVVQVDKWGFYHCDSSQPILYFNNGNTFVTLDKAGTVYFVSGDQDRCNKGQRMIVNVNHVHVRHHVPPPRAEPPHNPYYSLAPSPSQVFGSGLGSGVSLESGSAVLVSASFLALVVALAGVGLCLVQ